MKFHWLVNKYKKASFTRGFFVARIMMWNPVVYNLFYKKINAAFKLLLHYNKCMI